jgi:pantetheine-phosphate adenylyltransferase
MQRIGVYPGTFDPVTKGHLHMVKRASKLVDHLIVGVAGNMRKAPLFTLDERLEMLKIDVSAMHETFCTVEVRPINNLLIHFARDVGAQCVIRGLRAVSDFDYEFQMTGMNARMDSSIETVFLMAADRWQFVSSSFVKEIYSLGGDVGDVVTPQVEARLKEKFGG